MRTLETTDRNHAVNFMPNGTNKNDILVCACIIQYEGAYKVIDDYWFTVGRFKTIKGAVRSAKKQLAEIGHYSFNENEVENLIKTWNN